MKPRRILLILALALVVGTIIADPEGFSEHMSQGLSMPTK
jgi:hypothetical protein